ncbi:hypothetical protein ACFL1G_04515 [Planctomycetota bacterium]
MMLISTFVMANFLKPMDIETNPQSILWLLPLAAVVTIVYKTTKVYRITAKTFLKKAAPSFAFGIVLLVIAVLILLAFSWLVTE